MGGRDRFVHRLPYLPRIKHFAFEKRQNARRRHSAAQPKPSGKSAFFPRNVRPLGLKGKAFQTQNALKSRDLVEDLFSLRHLLVDVSFIDCIEIIFILALQDKFYLTHGVKEADKVYEIFYFPLFSI